eukprot:30865-Pelagococcus_subviridis.AAC.12
MICNENERRYGKVRGSLPREVHRALHGPGVRGCAVVEVHPLLGGRVSGREPRRRRRRRGRRRLSLVRRRLSLVRRRLSAV